MGLFDDGAGSGGDVTSGGFGGSFGGGLGFGSDQDGGAGFGDFSQNPTQRSLTEREKSVRGTLGGFVGGLIGGVLGPIGSLIGSRTGKAFAGKDGFVDIDPRTGELMTSDGRAIEGDQSLRSALTAFIQEEGGTEITAQDGSRVPVNVNEAGQLVDNSGNTVNETGQRVDPNGRLMTDSDIAIQDALGFQQAASTGAAEELRTGQQSALGALEGGSQAARVAARTAAGRGRDFIQDSAAQQQQFLSGGAQQGIDAARSASERAQGFLRQGAEEAQGFLSTQAQSARDASALGAQQGTEFLQQGAQDAQGFLSQQAERGISGIENQLAQTQGALDPFRQAGVGALEREQAALGLLGPEAQQAFFQEQTLSPAQKYLQDKQEQATLRTAAARGGLSGSRVQQALQEQQAGRSATILEDQLNRLSTLSGRGQQAAGDQGQFGASAQGQISGLLSQLGGRQSDVATGTAGGLASIADVLAGRGVGIESNLGAQQSGIATGTAAALASIEDRLAGREIDLTSSLGRQQAGVAAAQGSNLANIAGALGSQEVGIETGLGGQQANLVSGLSTNLSDLLLRSGENQAGAVLGGQEANAARQSNLNEIQARRDAEKSQQDSAFQTQLLGLGAELFKPAITNAFSGLF